jgi:hypothetical protein
MIDAPTARWRAALCERCNASQQPSDGDDRVKPGHDGIGSASHDGIGSASHDGIGSAVHDGVGGAGHDGVDGEGTFYTGRLTVSIVTSSVCAMSPEN